MHSLRCIYVFLFSLTVSRAASNWKTLIYEMSREKNLTHEIPIRKNFETTKYPQEKNLDPQNTHEKYTWAHDTRIKKF